MATTKKENKYGVRCPKCKSLAIWKIGFVPTTAGRKDRFKCTDCAHSFYRGQPGTEIVKRTVQTKPKRGKKAAG